MPLFEDYDLWARMLKLGYRGYNIQEPLLYMRAGNGMYARRRGLFLREEGAQISLEIEEDWGFLQWETFSWQGWDKL